MKAAVDNWGSRYFFRQAVGHSVRLAIAGLCLSSILVGYSSPNLGKETQFPDSSSEEEANPVASTGHFFGSTPWRSQQTIAQKRALQWIKANISSDSALIIDNYMWTDLHEEGNGENGYWRAHWYWKVDRDPEIKEDLFQEDWRYADYIVTTRQLLTDNEVAGLELVNQVLISSTPVAHFNTDGWPIEIRRVDKPQELPASADPILARTWDGYKERFLQDGRVIDPKTHEQTTSEGQSYAMLRAVYMDDRRAFDEVWGWTEKNLRVREDGLLAWQWGTLPDGTLGVIDQNSATDADTDTALALLFAAQRWNAPEYEQEAREILRGLWEQETVVVDGRRVVVAGNWAGGGSDEESSRAVVNPSYFAPYAYRIFAEADPEHEWMDLVDSSYQVLAQVRENPKFGGEVGLIPDWLVLDTDTGELLPADELGPTKAEEFSYDASRLPWRLSLDWLWFGDPRAKEAIAGLDFPQKELERDGSLLAAYKTDGSPATDEEATSMYAGIVPGLLLGENPDLANRVFAEKVLGKYVDDSQYPYWGDDPENYYNQNMAWFVTAIMDGGMSNLWEGATVIHWGNVEVRGCTSQCAAERKENIFKDTSVGG